MSYSYHKNTKHPISVESRPSDKSQMPSSFTPKRSNHEPREGVALSGPLFPTTGTPTAFNGPLPPPTATMGPTEEIKTGVDHNQENYPRTD